MADIPPPPPGFSLDAPAKVPPPPPGFKLDGQEPEAAAPQAATPEAKDPYFKDRLGNPVRMGGERDSGLTYQTPAGPTWQQATETLKQLQAQGVPQSDPRWQRAIKDRALGFERVGSGAMEQFGAGEATVGPLMRGAKALVPKAVQYGEGVISKALGTDAKAGAEALRDQEAKRAAEAAEAHQKEVDTYRDRLTSIEKAQSELAKQPGTAEARAHRQALRQAPFAEEQSRVLETIRSRVRNLESEYQKAGLSKEQASAIAEQEEQKVADAESAVSAMEKDLLARPQTTAQDFGGRIRQITQKISDKYSQIRDQQSGYKDAIEGAGNYERVKTKPIADQIDSDLKSVKNPSLQNTLVHIKGLLNNDGRPNLTIRQTDSLRKYLDSIIRSKSITTSTGPMAVDREALHYVADVKKQLMKTATESWQPYREALGRWSSLSRPLDVVQRNGALKKVIDHDPVSTDYALTEAEVVGQVLSQAKSGNPVFTRLLSESPELRDSARLYFTRDLFSKEEVPSPAALKTWLKNNESSLRQLGLYDEFRDIKVARETAQRAVEQAKGARKLSSDQIKEEEAGERKIAQDLRNQRGLREKQKSRIADAEKGVRSPEDIISESAKRAGEASKRLEREKGSVESEAAKKAKFADKYRQFQTEINSAKPQDVATHARSFIKAIRDDGMIDDAKYGDLLREVDRVKDTYQDAEKMKQAIRQVGITAAALVGVGAAAHTAGAVLPSITGSWH